MKIQKKPIDFKIIKLLRKWNETDSIDKMAEELGMGRNTLGEAMRTRNATPEQIEKLERKFNLIPEETHA